MDEPRKVLEEFFVAFNNADNEALRKVNNYPHTFLLGNGRTIIDLEPAEFAIDFERLRESEGWGYSTLDSATAGLGSEDKVHYDIVFSRYHEDGTLYRTVPAHWIVTNKDGHWGIQFRSILPPTYTKDER